MVTYVILPPPPFEWGNFNLIIRLGKGEMILQIMKSAAMLGTHWRRNGRIRGSNYSRMNQVKSVEDNL